MPTKSPVPSPARSRTEHPAGEQQTPHAPHHHHEKQRLGRSFMVTVALCSKEHVQRHGDMEDAAPVITARRIGRSTPRGWGGRLTPPPRSSYCRNYLEHWRGSVLKFRVDGRSAVPPY